MSQKLTTLNSGGIAIVCTPNMEKMARESYKEIRSYISKGSIDFHTLNVEHFSMGELLVQVKENVRNKDVYLFFDFNEDASRQMFVLQLTIDAISRAGAAGVTLMVPFIPFMRQDRKDRSRVPVSGRVAFDTFEQYPIVKRVITLDMHAAQCEMGLGVPLDHLPGRVIFQPWISKRFGKKLDQVVIVGPDAGSEKRVMEIASKLGCERSFFTKSRAGRGDSEVQVLHGADVVGKICIINDDMIDTGGTIISAANALMEYGASKVLITATHPVFGVKGGVTAYTKLREAGFEVVVADSLMTRSYKWLKVLPLARYMAHAILQNIVPNGSVSNIIVNGLPAKKKKK